MAHMREQSDSLGMVEVPADKPWGARAQRRGTTATLGLSHSAGTITSAAA